MIHNRQSPPTVCIIPALRALVAWVLLAGFVIRFAPKLLVVSTWGCATLFFGKIFAKSRSPAEYEAYHHPRRLLRTRLGNFFRLGGPVVLLQLNRNRPEFIHFAAIVPAEDPSPLQGLRIWALVTGG